TDRDGTPDITDTDDDGDGYTDAEETTKGSDPKNSGSIPATIIGYVDPLDIYNQSQTVVEGNPISQIMISPGNIDSELTVGTIYLPAGVSFNSSAYTIDGTPRVTNWAPNEESRKFEIPVEAKNPNGSKVNKVIEIIVQRDTDRDGNPDVTDTDDDGDGYTDAEETAKGSDPKDANSIPSIGINPIADQTVVEGNPITEIAVTTDTPSATVTVKDLPTGVT
ncbi:MAG: YSIRK signal domain/LPXTG anchor domain surface protein, partial [Solobacterium sp.]|nr:YSIRK signal domain/LPXTG anchor domain surface protein [Solobacterium sp.]